MIVKGWKIDTLHDYGRYGRETFTSYHNDPAQSSIDFQVARIGADVPDDWQPHITEVIVEERYVTPWQVVRQVVSDPVASAAEASEDASSPEVGDS